MEEIDRHRKRLRRYAGLFGFLGAVQIVLGVVAAVSVGEVLDDGVLFRFIWGAYLIACSTMAWNGSRAGAIAIVVWLVFNLVTTAIWSTISTTELVRSLVYTALSLLMTMHAFRHWRAVKACEGATVRGWAPLRWAGYAVLLPAFAFKGFGLALLMSPLRPDYAIVAGQAIPPKHLEWMREQSFLQSGEMPVYFYSEGLLSIEEGGNLLTDQYVGMWYQDEAGELQSVWTRLGTICEVKAVDDGTGTGIAVHEIFEAGADGTYQVWLPAGDTLHDPFLQRLEYLNAHNSNAEFEAACAEGRDVDWEEVSRLNGLPAGFLEAADIPARTRQWLLGKEYLTLDEQPEWLYSRARFDLEETGVLMTDTYFGGWHETNGELSSIWFEHGEICEISPDDQDDTDGVQFYRVQAAEEDRWYSFGLPETDETSHERVTRLMVLSEQYRTDEQAQACASRAAADAAGAGQPDDLAAEQET